MKLFATLLAAVAAACSFALPVQAAADIDAITTTPIRSAGKGGPSAMLAPKSVAGDVANAAAAWLAAQQDGAGAFPWTAGNASVYANTQGATALGLVRAWQRNGLPSQLAAAVAAGDCIIADCIAGMTYGDGDHRFATHDPLFLEELSQAASAPAYAAFVQAQLWDKFNAGVYGEANDVDAADFAAALLAGRGGIAELAAWDLAKMAIAAHVAGEIATRDALMAGVLQSLELTTGATHQVYDGIGLAGAVWASAVTGVDLDPAAGRWAAANSTADLAAALTGFQAPAGGFVAGTAQAVVDAEADAQSTAFAMQALAAADPVSYAGRINDGFDFLVGLQQGDGQFLSYQGAAAGIAGGVEVHGEALEAYAVVRLSTDRYVAPSGNDSGDCSQSALPCLTIQYAVDQANEGNTVHIASGTYVNPVVVATDGLRLLGEGATRPMLDRFAGATAQPLLVVDAAGVTVENLQFNADRTFVGEGVLCVGRCTGLTVRDSLFEQRTSNTAIKTSYGRTNAISAGVQVAGFPSATGPVQLTVQGVTIRPLAGQPDSLFRAGVALDGGFGLIGGSGAGQGNDIAARNHDVIVRNSRAGDVDITGNVFRGFGVQVATPAADSGAIAIDTNLFMPAATHPMPVPAIAADHSAMRLISNQHAVPLAVTNNVFDGHERGVLVENFPAVTLTGNSFTPVAGSGSFRHLVVSNKELFTDSPAPAPLPQSLALLATGNTFNAGTLAGMGSAVTLLNDNAQGEPVGGYYGTLQFGGAGAGEANAFDGAFGRYFELGNFSCANSNLEPCPLASLYAAAIGTTATRGTPVALFAGDVQAQHNTFDGVSPSAMDASQRNLLLARTLDAGSNPALGTVHYGIAATHAETFVDDDFAAAGYGDAMVFAHPDPAANGRTVYVGIDAFAAIGDAVAAVDAGGSVYVAEGSYAGNVSLGKQLSLIGAGGNAGETLVAGSLAIAASGFDTATPLLVRALRVTAPVGSGMQLTSGHSHLRFEGVQFVGNPIHGVDFVGIGNEDIAFVGPGCVFEANGTLGVRTSTSARASGVSFDGCSFTGNQAGIVVFGGSSGGDGQIIDWAVRDSTFAGNDSTDTSAFGGGIWIKTGGAGSIIDGFEVSGSLFEDNGSGGLYPPSVPVEDRRHLNRVGVTVRARPGTVLQGVRLCDNTYRETAAPGTQEIGVYVVDQASGTPGGTYVPVEVCGNNVTDGLLEGISGYEQFVVGDGRPRVNITGAVQVQNGGTGWNYIDAGDFAAVYVDDDYAALPNGTAVMFTHPVLGAPAPAVVGSNAFATIADALGAASSGASVYVAAGEYIEGDAIAQVNLRIEQPVNLVGAQAGIDARSRTDAGASIVRPAFANPGLGYNLEGTFATLVEIYGDDVSVDGFAFDGDNTAIATGLAMGGADPDVDGGMQISGERITIANNVVRNLVYSGIEAYMYPLSLPASEGNAIHHNRVQNIDAPSKWGVGILVHYNFYAAVTDNLVEDVRIGLQTGNHTKSIADPAGARVAGNSFEASSAGILHNAQYGNATPFTFDGNSIAANANPAQAGLWAGFVLQGLNNATTATVTGQQIDGSALAASGRSSAGYRVGLLVTSLASDTSIASGSVAGVDYGVLASDGALYAGAQPDVLVQGVAFTDIAQAAFYVEDTGLAGSETIDHAPRLTVGTGNTFANVAHQGALSGPLATIVYAPGADRLASVLVRSANGGHRDGSADSNGNVRSVADAIVDAGIALVATGGTVTLEQGSFEQNVVIDRTLTLRGPHAAVAGSDPARDGSDEAVIAATSGQAVRVHADSVVIEGLSFTGLDGSPASAAVVSGLNFGGEASDVTVRNNRFVALNGHGIYTNGPNRLNSWLVSGNLVDGVTGGIFSGINLWKVDGAEIVGNAVRNVAFGGIQLNANSGASVHGNRVENTGNNGINIGPDVVGAQVFDNTVVGANSDGSDPDEGALTIYGGASDVAIYCNVFDTTGGSNGITTKDDAALARPLGGNLAIFHNAVLGNASISHANSLSALAVGSNWYGGGAPTLAGDNAAGLSVAGALASTPIGDADCGDLTPAGIVAAGGTPQSTVFNTVFAAPLQARVVDGLGGGVAGATVQFTVPAAGASAVLASASGTTDFDGVFATTATANGVVGSYQASAASGALAAATFDLTNAKAVGSVTWGQLEFDYDGQAHAITATVTEDGSACVVTPASIGPDVGSESVSASCTASSNYDVAVANATASIGGDFSVHVLETGEFFATVAGALADADTLDGHTIELAPGIYGGPIVLTKGVHLKGGGITGLPAPLSTLAGTTSAPTTIVDGGNAVADGVVVASDVTGATISGLEVRNFTRHCVAGMHGAWGLTVRENLVHECGGRGITVAGGGTTAHPGIVDVTIENNEVHSVGDRGIVVWDGIKQDVTIASNWVHDIAGCCGIELQDGAATGAVVIDNVVENTGDSGMAFIQLTSGSPSGRANLIARNRIENTGRFGMEIKIPNGTGLDSGDGAIVVEDNMIDGGGVLALRDRAGIAVHRRALSPAYPFEVDATIGVVVRDNLVTGFRTSLPGYEGYGIVVEGVASSVGGNVLGGNDVGLQLQQGNPDGLPPGDSDQNAISDWFSRGNAPLTCAIVGDNAFGDGSTVVANGIDERTIPAGTELVGAVRNQTTGAWYCSINAAIAAASAGDLLSASAGEYPENVLLDKSLALLGPYDGTPGHDPARDVAGAIATEAVINPATGSALRMGATGAQVRGFTIAGVTGTAVLQTGSARDAMVFADNRVLDVSEGVGIRFEPGEGSPASGFVVEDNLFRNITGASGLNGSGVQLYKGTRDAVVRGNRFEGMQRYAIQANGGNGRVVGVSITGNQIQSTGTSLVVTGTEGTTIHGNTVSGGSGALFLSDRTSDLTVTCNALTAGGTAVAASDFFGGAANGNVRILHNAVSSGASAASNGMAQVLVVGSNWYTGAAPASGGNLLMADALPGAPLLSDPLCGDNTPAGLVAHAGTPQSATTGQAFAVPLQARVIDGFGGAVAGEAVSFGAPVSGASAGLADPLVTSDFNGVASTAAFANGFAGSYMVQATGPVGSVDFALENLAQQQVRFDLNGPVGGVEVGDEVAYTGFIANQNPAIVENVLIRIEVAATQPLDAGDVDMCVVNPMDAGQCLGIAWSDNGATLGFDFPDASGFDITSPLPYAWIHQFRTIYGRADVYTATAHVIGVDSGTVYASDVIATEVVDRHAGVSLDLDGPVAGVEKDAPTAYLARLRNSADDVADPVVVEFTVTRSGGILAGDITVEYDTGGGVFAVLPLFDDGGALVGVFGPGAGFPLPSGYDATTAFRVTYHTAPDSFSVAATVVDAGADSDGVTVYAADQLATEVIEADPDIALDLSGPFDTGDETLVAAQVDVPVLITSSLLNAGGAVPDLVQAAFTVSTDFAGIEASDVVATYWLVAPGDSCLPLPAVGDRETVAFTDDGDVLTATTTPQPLGEGMEVMACYEIAFAKAGVYNIAAVIEDAAGDSDGIATYAGDNLAMTVAQASGTVSLSDLAWTYDGAAHQATVTTVPAGLPVTVTYDGAATLPVDAGSYAVTATVDHPDFVGSASGVLTIAPKTLTLALSNLGPHTYDGLPHAAIVTVDGLVGGDSLDVEITYSSSTAVPVDAGSWLVVATFDPALAPNYVALPAFGTLEIVKAEAGLAFGPLGPFTYDGLPKPVAPANPNGVAYAIAYEGVAPTSYGPSAVPPVDAGSYLATATVDDANYAQSPVSAGYVVEQAVVGVAFGNLAHTYDGSAKLASASTTPAGVAVGLAYSQGAAPVAAPVDAGSYDVSATVEDANYVLAAPASATLVVAKATAQLTLSDLTQLYDGNGKSVTTATQPAGLPVTVAYAGGAALPTAVGSYAVEALVDHANYAGSANGTLTILAAAISGFEVDGASSFTGIAGTQLQGALPTVRVSDSEGNGVPGVSVTFTALSGSIPGTGGPGGGTAQTVATDADGKASVSAWRLSADAGSGSMTAEVSGLAGLPVLAFDATGEEQADIAVLKTSEQTVAASGEVVDYTIVVTNAGPSNAQSVDVLDVLPAELDALTAQWLCVAADGASCNGADDGNGDVAVDALVPVGGSVTIVLSATIAEGVLEAPFDNMASAILASGTDPVAGNDTSTATVTVVAATPAEPEVFKDGFEGEAVVTAAKLGGAPAAVSLVPDWKALDLRPRPVMELVDAHGDSPLMVDAIATQGRHWLRLRSRSEGRDAARAWVRWDSADALVDQQLRDGVRTLFVVGQAALIEHATAATQSLRVARPRSGAQVD